MIECFWAIGHLNIMKYHWNILTVTLVKSATFATSFPSAPNLHSTQEPALGKVEHQLFTLDTLCLLKGTCYRIHLGMESLGIKCGVVTSTPVFYICLDSGRTKALQNI